MRERRARLLRPWSQELQWAAIGLLAAVTLVLGYIGAYRYLSEQGEAGPWVVLYTDLQLFVLEQGAIPAEVPWQFDVARLMAPAVTVLAAAKGLTLLLRDDWNLLRARLARDHVIVCGLGRIGLRLTRSLLQRGDRVVVIEANADDRHIRPARRARAGVVTGDATDPEVLQRAGVQRAGWLISVCAEDGTNAAVAAAARPLARDRRQGHSLACMIHVYDHALADLMRSEQVAAAEELPFRLDVFNVFENGARAMVLDHPIAPAGGGALRPHVVVVGLGWLGTQLVAEIARAWRDDGGLDRDGQLPVTLVDPEAEERRRSLLIRNPRIEQACALRAAAVAVGRPEFESGEFLDRREAAPADGLVAYVCLDDTTLALDAALTLRDRAGEGARIVVRTDTGEGLGSLLERRPADSGAGIVAFPLLDRVCDAESVIGFTFTEQLARTMHADYLEHRPHDPSDPSMRPWDELDEELREGNRDQARDVGRKLRIVGCDPYPLHGSEAPGFRFSDAEVETLARKEHERWVADRRRNGWKPGPRDPRSKTSPYLVPFDEVSPDVREFDRDAVRSLPRILARAGYGIRRSPSSPPR